MAFCDFLFVFEILIVITKKMLELTLLFKLNENLNYIEYFE